MVCGESFPKFINLIKHVNNKHKIKSKDYYDQYIKDGTGGICSCGEPTKFINATKGYRKHCSKVCATTYNRAFLRSNEDKFSKFKNKVSSNMINEWSSRKSKGSDITIHDKIKKTQKENANLLTESEKVEKFGWMNKLSIEDRNAFINEIMLNTGMHKWWENATDCEKAQVIKKRTVTRYGSEEYYLESISKKDDFAKYSELVRNLTEKTYHNETEYINPHNLPRTVNEYHLDHKCSVKDCYLNDVPPEIAASKYNLEMLHCSENHSKGSHSSQTVKELTEKYNGKI